MMKCSTLKWQHDWQFGSNSFVSNKSSMKSNIDCNFYFQFNIYLNYTMLDQMNMYFHEKGQAGILSNADDGESTQSSLTLPNNGG